MRGHVAGVRMRVVCEDLSDEAARELPFAYAAALRLARGGAGDEVIARALGIAPAGVPAALALARAKLAALERNREQPEEGEE